MTKIPVAIVGPGNVGLDLMYKLMRSSTLEPQFMIGTNPDSVGLRRAHAEGMTCGADGADWLLNRPDRPTLVFEATSAAVHAVNAPRYAEAGITAIDLTPSAYGCPVIPCVNLDQHLDAPNISTVSCAGQVAVPIVFAIDRIAHVLTATMTATIAAPSAGPGTLRNLDAILDTTSWAIRILGNAQHATSAITVDSTDPPPLMRVEVRCVTATAREADITASLAVIIGDVARYVPGYRLTEPPSFCSLPSGSGHQTTVRLEVEGAGDYLPAYAGNLDIITAAAVHIAEALADRQACPHSGPALTRAHTVAARANCGSFGRATSGDQCRIRAVAQSAPLAQAHPYVPNRLHMRAVEAG